MNCPNCGAPMALMATRPCWACGHCGSVVCSETAEGVRVTGETGHACPLCRIPLVRGVLDDRERIETCERCKGIFMPRRAFAVTLLARRRQPQTPVVAGAWTDPRALERRIACPACSAPMIADWYYGPGNIVIDTCPSCDVVWLDAGELDRATKAPGGDRRA